MIVSIFNGVIGPVMRGPSSSHCAAGLRIGRLARDLVGGKFDDVLVEFDRNGSLPTTHDTQGSDMGLFGGLMGWEADDERLADSMRILRDTGVRIRIETVEMPVHIHDQAGIDLLEFPDEGVHQVQIRKRRINIKPLGQEYPVD